MSHCQDASVRISTVDECRLPHTYFGGILEATMLYVRSLSDRLRNAPLTPKAIETQQSYARIGSQFERIEEMNRGNNKLRQLYALFGAKRLNVNAKVRNKSKKFHAFQ
jgi:hypothetical protein